MIYPTTIHGKVEAALVCDVPGSLVSSRKEKILVHLAGIAGDRHYGFTFPSNGRYSMYPRHTEIRNSRQVSIISMEEMSPHRQRTGLPELHPEWYGANLILSGIPALTFLPPSTRLTFQNGAVLIVTGENDPCIHVGRILQTNFPITPTWIPPLSKPRFTTAALLPGSNIPVSSAPAIKSPWPSPNISDYTQFLNPFAILSIA